MAKNTRTSDEPHALSHAAAVVLTRKLDALDVVEGRRIADYFHFIPRSVARQSKPEFPPKYRKS